MIRKITYMLCTLLFIVQALSAQNVNTIIEDPDLDFKKILVGECTPEALTKGEFGAYYESQYELYQPASKYTEKLKEKINLVDITVVFATWCSDSKIQVPRFFKVLNASSYNKKRMKIVAVNRQKNAVTTNIQYLDIELVPTFVISQNGKELGRIVETPKKSLETDLWKIVNKAKFQEFK